MVSTETPVCDFNTPAINFNLKGVDGKMHTLESCKGDKGLLVMFICNHCPYVKAIINRIVRDTKELKDWGLTLWQSCPIIQMNTWKILLQTCKKLPKISSFHSLI